MPLYYAISYSASNVVFTASASSWWLSLFPSGGKNKLTLICVILASASALCRSLREPSHLFDQFPIICIYFNTVLIWLGPIINWEVHHFFVYRIIHFFFLSNQKCDDRILPYNHFLNYSIKKKTLYIYKISIS